MDNAAQSGILDILAGNEFHLETDKKLCLPADLLT